MPQLLRWQSSSQAFIEPLGEGQQLTMLRIPAGRFLMGSPEQESGRDPGEGPVHAVELEEFLLASTPITQAQWRQVARWEPPAGAAWQSPLPLDPSLYQGSNAELLEAEPDSAQRPVQRISWEEAMEFCRRLSQRSGRRYSLPSEAQWEYACRACSTGPYAFGDTLTPELARVRPSSGRFDDPQISAGASDSQQSNPVAMFPANAWGLYDMHGQVWEWCLDHWHDRYHGAPADGSAWLDQGSPASADRVLRGGAWSQPLSQARSACRYHLPAESHAPAGVGLRVVCLPGGSGEDLGIVGAEPDKWHGLKNSNKPVVGLLYSWANAELADQLRFALRQDQKILVVEEADHPHDAPGDFVGRVLSVGLLVAVITSESLRSEFFMKDVFRAFRRSGFDRGEFDRNILPLFLDHDTKAEVASRFRLLSFWQDKLDEERDRAMKRSPAPDQLSAWQRVDELGEMLRLLPDLFICLCDQTYPTLDEALQRRGQGII